MFAHFSKALLWASFFALVGSFSFSHEPVVADFVVPDPIYEWRPLESDEKETIDPELISYRPGWYIGGGLGPSEVAPEGSSGGYFVRDDRDFGFKLFAGRRLTEHWGLELSYVETGSAGIGHVNPAVEATFDDPAIRYHIPTVSAAYYVFGSKYKVDVFGRVGISSIVNTVSDDRIPYEKNTILQLNLGAGIEWRFAPRWFARLEFDSYDNDASLLALSLGYYLASHNEHKTLPEPAPEPAPEPEVEPLILPEATCKQFSGAIDAIQFEIDSDQLTPGSDLVLISAAESLKEYPTVEIEIQAHTDSSASDEYNLDLSNRRASTIRSFLINQGIAEERLTATGFGESLPRASNETVEGRALNRRVEFEIVNVTGCTEN